jgi:hypothetical protein
VADRDNERDRGDGDGRHGGGRNSFTCTGKECDKSGVPCVVNGQNWTVNSQKECREEQRKASEGVQAMAKREKELARCAHINRAFADLVENVEDLEDPFFLRQSLFYNDQLIAHHCPDISPDN